MPSKCEVIARAIQRKIDEKKMLENTELEDTDGDSDMEDSVEEDNLGGDLWQCQKKVKLFQKIINDYWYFCWRFEKTQSDVEPIDIEYLLEDNQRVVNFLTAGTQEC